jgi:hypothetical protein
MAGDHRFARRQRVVVRGVDAALVAMLNDNIIIEPARPTRLPLGEVVLEMNAVDLRVFRGNGG